MSKVLKLIIGVLTFAFFMATNPVSYVLLGAWTSQGSWTSTAEARVGRPATPVSAAGVAWRGVARGTTRRCVEGVYPC